MGEKGEGKKVNKWRDRKKTKGGDVGSGGRRGEKSKKRWEGVENGEK